MAQFWQPSAVKDHYYVMLSCIMSEEKNVVFFVAIWLFVFQVNSICTEVEIANVAVTQMTVSSEVTAFAPHGSQTLFI